jgi:predicted transcriptional regulator
VGRLRKKRLRPTTLAAAGFVVLAFALAIVHAKTSWWSAWTPNLGASCLEIAATIWIVERLVRREERRFAAPLVAHAHAQIANCVEWAAARLVDDRWPPSFADHGTLRKHLAEMASEDAYFSPRLGRLDQLAEQTADDLERIVRIGPSASALNPALVVEVERLASDLRRTTNWHVIAEQPRNYVERQDLDPRDLGLGDEGLAQEQTGRGIVEGLTRFVEATAPLLQLPSWQPYGDTPASFPQ